MIVYGVLQLVLQPIAIHVVMPIHLTAAIVILVLCTILPCIIPIRDLLLPDRSDCCAEALRLSRLRRLVPLPRVLLLSGLCPVTDVPYLQHVEEMQSYDWKSQPITAHKLPRSLRRLSLTLYDYGVLKTDALPPRLTVLIVEEVDKGIRRRRLSQSLVMLIVQCKLTAREVMDLVLARIRCHDGIRPIAAGVLPSQLQWLDITWNRSLADLALPKSLVRLELRHPCITFPPIPPNSLPPHLHTLCIYGWGLLAHHLAGALPSSLRVLRLHCFVLQWSPLTAELLAQVPLLEELDLGGGYQHSLTGVLAPLTRLRVLRVYGVGRRPFKTGTLPLSLRRLTMVTVTMEEADALVPMAVRHVGLVVGFDNVRWRVTRAQTTTEIFAESRRMTAQVMQRSGEESQSGDQQHQSQHDNQWTANSAFD